MARVIGICLALVIVFALVILPTTAYTPLKHTSSGGGTLGPGGRLTDTLYAESRDRIDFEFQSEGPSLQYYILPNESYSSDSEINVIACIEHGLSTGEVFSFTVESTHTYLLVLINPTSINVEYEFSWSRIPVSELILEQSEIVVFPLFLLFTVGVFLYIRNSGLSFEKDKMTLNPDIIGIFLLALVFIAPHSTQFVWRADGSISQIQIWSLFWQVNNYQNSMQVSIPDVWSWFYWPSLLFFGVPLLLLVFQTMRYYLGRSTKRTTLAVGLVSISPSLVGLAISILSNLMWTLSMASIIVPIPILLLVVGVLIWNRPGPSSI